jgi:hypothetical protein
VENVHPLAAATAIELKGRGDAGKSGSAEPGFGGLLGALLASDEGEREQERRRREADLGAAALGVGMPTVGCQADGGQPDNPRQSASDSPPEELSGLGPRRDDAGNHGGRRHGSDAPTHSIDREKTGINGTGGSDASTDGRSGDRALVAVLENLVRRLHQVAVAAKPGVGLVVSLGELGEVKIDVRFAGKTMLVRAEVGSMRAAAMLTSAVPELRERLAVLGWRLGRLELRTPGGAHELASAMPAREPGDRAGDRRVGTHDGALDVLA